MKVSKGLATWAGLVGALGAFLLALATFMDTFNELDPLAGLGPLVAAAGVLWKVIDGRMKQATALAGRPAAAPAPAPAVYAGTTSSGTTAKVTWGPGGPTPATKPGEFDREPDTPPEAELRDLHENEQS